VRRFKSTFAICKDKFIRQPIDTDIPDFEDAVRYFRALHAGTDCILSRNARDFARRHEISVLPPREFLAEIEME
jgi:hypothetical protein